MITSRTIIFLMAIWSIFLFNSLQVRENFIYVSLNSIILIVCFILSIFIGSIVFNLNNYSTKYKLYSSYKPLTVENKFFKFCLIGYSITLLVIFLRKINYQVFLNIKLDRYQLYSPIINEPHIISMIYVFVIFVKSLFLSFLFFFFFKFLFKKKYIEIILIIAAIFFESFIFNSKGILLSLILILILYFFLLRVVKKNIYIFFQCIQTIIIILLSSYILDSYRGGYLIDTIINYLRVGPALLSSVVDNNFQVFYNKWSFDNIFIIFSGLDYLITILFRGLGFSIQTYGYEFVKFLDSPQVVSADIINYNFSMRNSFYTILLEPYISFGFFGVIFFGFSFGYIISKHEYIYKKFNCDYSLFCLQFFAGVIFNGIFGSAFSTVLFWLILFFMIFLKSFFFIKNPKKR